VQRSEQFTHGGQVPALVIEASGGGRPYNVKNPEAWWRDLTEVTSANEARAIAFVRRRGDPLALLEQGKSTGTGGWLGLIAHLQPAAAAWGPLDAEGVSTFTEDGPEWARVFADGLPAGWEKEHMGHRRVGLHLMPVAHRLDAYLVASALACLRQRRPMRRCAFCHSWFTRNHAAAEFCSAACRSASSNGRKAPYGLSNKMDDERGDDPLEGAVAGTGAGRVGPPSAELRHLPGGEGVGGQDAPRARTRPGRRPE
jgi:hypothetical protein